MANREIILHEYVDITGQSAWPYMEHIKIQNRDARVGFELLGTWYTMGITARWPQVVNLWDSGGWDGWLERVDRLNLKRKSNDLLDEWWEEAYKLRTGGYDRVLGSVPESPPVASVFAGEVRGTLYIHELTEVRPGSARDYLAAMASDYLPAAADYGYTCMGLWEVLHHDYEVCTVWAASPEAYIRLNKAADAAAGFDEGVDGDDRLLAWRATAQQYTTRFREELMTPAPGTLTGPEAYEDDTFINRS